MIRWVTSKGYAVLLPSSSYNIGSDMNILLERLSPDVIGTLDSLEEGLKTTWEAVEQEGPDDAY